MRQIWLSSAIVLSLAGMAGAQEAPAGCEGRRSDSLEASVLDCPEANLFLARPVALEVLGDPPPPFAASVSVLSRGLEGSVSADLPRVVSLTSSPVLGPASGATADLTSNRRAVPVGQRSPPGLCRVWFPDDHPGRQRVPTSCDVEVPEGAVLILG